MHTCVRYMHTCVKYMHTCMKYMHTYMHTYLTDTGRFQCMGLALCIRRVKARQRYPSPVGHVGHDVGAMANGLWDAQTVENILGNTRAPRTFGKSNISSLEIPTGTSLHILPWRPRRQQQGRVRSQDASRCSSGRCSICGCLCCLCSIICSKFCSSSI